MIAQHSAGHRELQPDPPAARSHPHSQLARLMAKRDQLRERALFRELSFEEKDKLEMLQREILSHFKAPRPERRKAA